MFSFLPRRAAVLFSSFLPLPSVSTVSVDVWLERFWEKEPADFHEKFMDFIFRYGAELKSFWQRFDSVFNI